MKHHFTIHIPAGQQRERLDLYLTGHVENATRNKVQQAIRSGEVRVNGACVKVSYPVMPNDVIEVQLSSPPPPDVLPEEIPLQIVYDDESLLVVNKPAGMVTHPAYKHYSGTLVNALLYYCDSLSQPHPMRPGIVHRLDKDTSGLLVVAKNESTHEKLSRQFAQKTSEREYWAIVWGRFKEPSGTIDAPLGRSKADRKKMAIIADGKSAVTEYEVIEQFEYLSLVKLHLRTGRTHQIRVHLASLHHPIFCDSTYGGDKIVAGGTDGKRKAEVANLMSLIGRQALHAKKLGFVHPVRKELMRFDSELPEDMQAVLNRLRKA
ncbi:MAG: RluA family pseudouridine synthase [Ignavibacteriales bacterium]|nr:RluA family pseudouridine synthase [Ignavibacteriales bacterium]